MSGLNPDIFTFFKALKENNNREWFTPQKKRFKALEADVKDLGARVQLALGTTEHIDSYKLFRIYRDVRFSKDKTPFKTHFGMSFHREKPEHRGGYYMHLAPGDNFLAAGFWNPNKDDLLRIRKELEFDAKAFREVQAQPKVKQFWGTVQGDALKTAPKGFSKEHPDIDLLRLKQFLFIHKLDDTQVLAPTFETHVAEVFKAIRPVFDHFSQVLTTNLNGESII